MSTNQLLQQFRTRLPSLQGLSDEEAVDAIQGAFAPQSDRYELASRLGVKLAPPPPPPPPEEPGVLRSAGDSALALGQGVVSGAKMLTDAFGAENTASEGLGKARDWLGSMESAYSQWERQQIAADMEAAKGQGFMAEAGAAVRGFTKRPLDMVLEGVGTSLPTLAAAFLPGGQTAAVVRIGAMVGLGGAQGAGSVKGQIHQEVEQAWLKDGASPEEARARADKAQEYFGSNQGQIALGTALGGAAGVLGVEANLLGKRILAKFGGEAAEQLAKKEAPTSLMGKAFDYAKAGAAEAAPEFLQGGQEAYAGGSAVRNEGFDVDPWAGVGGNATLEALAGFGMGAVANAVPSADPINDAQRKLADAKSGGDAIAAFNQGTAALFDGERGLANIEALRAADEKALKLSGRLDNTPTPTVPPATMEELGASAELVDAPFGDRVLNLRTQLANDVDRDLVRERVGADALNEALYYLGLADDPNNGLPEKTRENALAMAESIVDAGRVRGVERSEYSDPLAPRAGEPERIEGSSPLRIGMDAGPARIGMDTSPSGTMVADADGNVRPQTRAESISLMQRAQERASLGAQAPGRQPGAALRPDGPPALGYDTAPTGTLRADAAGNVAPETRAQAINTAQAQAERESLGQQQLGRRAAPAAAPAPRPLLQIAQDRSPSGRLIAGTDGQVRPELRTEQSATARRQQLLADIGLTPDVMRAQQARAGEPNAGRDETVAGGAGGDGLPGAAQPAGAGGVVSDGGSLPAVVADRAGRGDGAGQGEAGAPGALSEAKLRELVPGGLFVQAGNQRFQVNSLRDAQVKWAEFRDSTGAGVSQLGNGVRVVDGAGRQVARVSYNGRLWADDNAERLLAEAPDESIALEGDDAPAALGNDLAGEAIDAEWVRFKPESGTKSIPRADMPQIKAEHRGAMVNFLGARGITHESAEVDARELKPTQAEFSLAKVAKAKGFEGGDRSILVSADGHVLDGHHQWVAAREQGKPVKVIRLNAPIDKLLAEVKEFPSATTGEGAPAAGSAAKAFKTKTAATLEARKTGGKVVPVDGGYAVEPQAAVKKANPTKTVNPERDTLLEAVAKLGGISRESAKRFGLTPEELKHQALLNGKFKALAFRVNGGRDVDAMRELLAEAGYFDGVPEDEQMATLEEAIKDELGGNPRLATAGVVRQTEQRAREDAEADAEALAAELAAEDAAERAAILAENGPTEAEMSAIADDDLGDVEVLTGADAMAALGFTKEEINAERERESAEPGAAAQAGPAEADSAEEARPRGVRAPDGAGEGQAGRGEDKQQGLTKAERSELEKDYTLHPDRVLGELLRRDEALKLYRAAGARSAMTFEALPVEDRAKAYADYVAAGGERVAVTSDYNGMVRQQERDAATRRMQSDATVQQANGKPFKTELSAKGFASEWGLEETHDPIQAGNGWVLRKLPDAAVAERKRKAEGRESYAEAQAAVAKEMGITENADGEWDATEAQFDELERRTQARLRGKAAPEPELLASQTEADLATKTERESRAEELDEREQVQREAGAFQLSSQEAVETREDTTGDLFGGPSAEDLAAARKREAAGKGRQGDGNSGDLFSQPEPEPEPPAADIAAEQYAQLEGATVEQSVTIEETGQTATLRMDAAAALRQLDERRQTLESLKACIGRSA